LTSASLAEHQAPRIVSRAKLPKGWEFNGAYGSHKVQEEYPVLQDNPSSQRSADRNFGGGNTRSVRNEHPTLGVRQIAGVPESKKLVIEIAIGYPDWDFPANKLQSTREPLDNIVTWRGV
jgi:hypothetical protein